MILIVGGMGQGKTAFAAKQFPGLEKLEIVDGNTASWEEFLKAGFAVNLQEMIRRRLMEGEMPDILEQEMARELVMAHPGRVLVVNEIGCGIVPMDKFSRSYRETAGRIGCQLAQMAQEVWRVSAGIGQKLK